MEVSYDKKFNLNVQLNKQDIIEAMEIMRTINSEGWKILKDKYYSTAREQLLSEGKQDLISKEAEKNSRIRLAMLFGFDTFQNLPEAIMKQVTLQNENKEEESGQHEEY